MSALWYRPPWKPEYRGAHPYPLTSAASWEWAFSSPSTGEGKLQSPAQEQSGQVHGPGLRSIPLSTVRLPGLQKEARKVQKADIVPIFRVGNNNRCE